MIELAEDALQHIVEVIVFETHPEQIILFGPRARKTSQPGSDLDLLIVESNPFGPGRNRFHEIARIEKALSGVSIPTDILVYSHDEFECWRNEPGHIINHAMQEGTILYERS